MPFRLPTQEEKANYVHRQFERIAKRYDLTNDVISMGMHRSWKKRAVESLIEDIPNAMWGSFLDVCTGTGDLALTISRRIGATGHITGLDFSQNMLDVAEIRERMEPHRRGQLHWLRGDALQLPFEDNKFDGAIISFGLRNLTDYLAGIKEMARVVRPGGHVVNLDLGHSKVPGFAPVFHTYFRYVVPIIGDIIQQDRQAYTYLPESLNIYPKPEAITDLFKQAGLVDVVHEPLALGSVALHRGTKPAL